MTISLTKIREATDIMKSLDAKHAKLSDAVADYMGEREVAAGALSVLTGEPIEAVLAQLPAVPRGRKARVAPEAPPSPGAPTTEPAETTNGAAGAEE